MKTSPPPCPTCVEPTIVYQRGTNRSGSQRYHCTACNHYFTPQPKPQGYAPATRQTAVRMYLENVGLRSVGRLLGVSHVSVGNWINRHADALPDNVDALDPRTGEVTLDLPTAQVAAPPANELDEPTTAPAAAVSPRRIVIEADELYTYVGKKKSKSTSF